MTCSLDSLVARRRFLSSGRRLGRRELAVPLNAGELSDVGDAGEDVAEDGDGHGARVLREDEAAHHVDQHLLRENEKGILGESTIVSHPFNF